MSAEIHSADTARLLRRLLKGLDNRRSLPGGAARTGLDEHLLGVLQQLMSQLSTDEVTEDVVPPRPVSTALILALCSQPHVAVTFPRLPNDATEPLLEPDSPPLAKALVLPAEVLEPAFGLPSWEIDELREEVDVRAGRVLKQARALQWLWGRFGLPEASGESLFRVLLPGAPQRIRQIGLIRRGAQLYAAVNQDPPPPLTALFVGSAVVIAGDDEMTFHPLDTFHGRYVDAGLMTDIGRAIGAEADELAQIADHSVTVLPQHLLAEFLRLDRWRSGGFAAISDLGSSYSEAMEPTRMLAPADIDVTDWMALKGDDLAVRSLRRVFDHHALIRVGALMRQVYTLMLARLLNEDLPPGPMGDVPPILPDLEILDLNRHLTAVLAPVLDWTRSRYTAEFLARHFDVAPSQVSALLKQVEATWVRHRDQVWLGPPREGQPLSVQSLLVRHLVATLASIRRILARPPQRDQGHRELLLLFAAHYFASSPLRRLWASTHEDGQLTLSGELTTDPVGRWFWASYTRLLSFYDPDVTGSHESNDTFN